MRLFYGMWSALAALWGIVPVVVHAEPPPLSAYGQLPGFERAALSPSGKHVAVVGMIGAKRSVVVLDDERKPVLSIPVDTNAKIRGLTWAGDQAVLIDCSATVGLSTDWVQSKVELGSVVVVSLDGAKPWTVFAGDDHITGGAWGTYGVVEKAGHWVGYFGGLTYAPATRGFPAQLPLGRLRPDLYEVDLQSHKARKIANHISNEDGWRAWLIDANGEVGPTLDLTVHDGVWTITNAQGKPLVTGIDKYGDVSLIGFTPDGTGVVYSLVDSDKQVTQWFAVPLAGGPPQPYLDGIEIERRFLDQGDRLLGYIEDTAGQTAHFFNPHDEAAFKAVQRAFPGKRLILRGFNTAFDHLLVVTEGPGDPESWWLVNLATRHADPLGHSYPIDSDAVGPMRMVPYVAADGLRMEGVLTLPPDRPAHGLPAVVLPHGGPAAHDTVDFDWIAQAFASRGYAVFQPNFRGSSGYGTAFEMAGFGEWGRKMQTDVSDGLAELVHQGIVDPHRVCIVGASYGGYVALAGITLQHGIYRCAVAVAGVSDPGRMFWTNAYENNARGMWIRNLKREIGPDHDVKLVSPIHYVDKVDVPVLLIHGKDDTVVNYDQSTTIADALRHAGKSVDLVTLVHEDHWLSHGDTRLQMLDAAMTFVLHNNPPDTPAPAR